MSKPPVIPENSPFSLAQRLWLNGYLAAMFGSEEGATTAEESVARPRVLVLWASQSGNAEGLAEQFGQQLAAGGFDAPVISMADHETFNLTKEKQVLMISSTWGEGDPPDNAVEFWEKLSAEDHPSLPDLGFAVLGLGDSNYLDFCAMGKRFDARLEALGAKRLSNRGDCDVDFEEPAAAWFSEAMEKLDRGAAEAPVNGSSPNGALPAAAPEPAVVAAWSKSNPFGASLLVNQRLNGADSERDTRHFEISLGDSGLSYEVGDVLGTFPQNCPDLVGDILSALKCSGDETVPGAKGEETPLRQALLSDYAITTISRKFLSTFAERVGSEALKLLMGDDAKETLGEYLWGREIIDLLLENPGHGLSPSEFVGMLGKLAPRLYSIASSPKAHPGEVHLTVARVGYSSHGRERKGVASTWLADRVGEGGSIPMFLQVAKHFKLPENPDTPVIMVGPGTGIAPFRAFLEERQTISAKGKNWLFFGNPYRKTDFFYEEQLTTMYKSGHLTHLDLAWSRDQAAKVYVQDLMRQRAAELWSWVDAGAHFYVCGDAKRMAKDVDSALQDLIAEHGGYGTDGAADYVAAMKKDKRYQRDVY